MKNDISIERTQRKVKWQRDKLSLYFCIIVCMYYESTQQYQPLLNNALWDKEGKFTHSILKIKLFLIISLIVSSPIRTVLY